MNNDIMMMRCCSNADLDASIHCYAYSKMPNSAAFNIFSPIITLKLTPKFVTFIRATECINIFKMWSLWCSCVH